MKRLNILFPLLLVLLLASCAGNRAFQKLLKSSDNEQKLEAARGYMEDKDYTRALSLLENVAPYFRGTKFSHEVLFLTAKSQFGLKDFFSAAYSFESYAKLYPKDDFAEESKFMQGYCYYQESPDVRLDQQMTHRAIAAFRAYLELYPEGVHAADVQKYLDELNEKLAQKELLSARLYFDMGIYLGNNYRAAAIAAENAIKDFPASKFREDFSILVLRAKFHQAQVSVAAKQTARYEEALEAFQNYIADFPEGKFQREARQMHAQIVQSLK
ncbi:MAG: outer membrane protein assembly factor BamD [Prevotellaceae bacterium]|nr:outer membrane protein assembly factor BamD [Prevotellaceae bacterium]